MIVKRIAPYAAAAVLFAAGAAASLAHADDPAPTVTVVVTQTVNATYQGWTIRKWARKTAIARREANQQHKDSQARGRTIGRLRRANRARLQFGPDGLTHAFLCIHTFEGAWTAATGNGYHGGVQMDANFMAAYGGPFYRAWGTADHWPPFVQIAVAEAAYLSGRGFGPWPLTSKACGL